MFVLSHHFSRCGFEFDFATVAGKPIALEGWTVAEAWGSEDVIKAMRDSVVDGLTSPKKFDDITNLDKYAAVFIPSGHVPVIDLNLYLTLGSNPLFGAFAGCDHDFSLPWAQRRSTALERDLLHNGSQVGCLPFYCEGWSAPSSVSCLCV